MNYQLLPLEVHGDKRGKLVSLESEKNIPFEIRRVYYIFDTLPEESRGQHAHRTLEQLVVAIDGSCQFVLDDGKVAGMGRHYFPLRAEMEGSLPFICLIS